MRLIWMLPGKPGSCCLYAGDGFGRTQVPPARWENQRMQHALEARKHEVFVGAATPPICPVAVYKPGFGL